MLSKISPNTIEQSARQNELTLWLQQVFAIEGIKLQALSGDAGFRKYYRFVIDNKPYIAVDAPNDKSNNQGFVAIAKLLSTQGVNVPDIQAYDNKDFFCLSDMGNKLLSDVLTQHSMDTWYRQAIDLLPNIALTQATDHYELPVFDRPFILTELAIFTEWLLAEHLQISLTEHEAKELAKCFDILVTNALEQPQVFMHRDFHSRNIMVLDEKVNDSTLCCIDFQDAVKGPITYDIVSLLRDCYVRWPDAKVAQLLNYFITKISTKLDINVDAEKWQRWFDLMGLQRHIKASGIFARLLYRDGKPGYLKDIPLTVSYIQDVSASYPELKFLHQLVTIRVIPAINQHNKEVTT